MDEPRAAKRRRLDTTDPPSPPPATTPAAQSSTVTAGAGAKKLSAQESWQAAKAAAAELKKQRRVGASAPRVKDVYDDFEGAHTGQNFPTMRQLPATAPRKRAQIDPLQNQKTVASSPARPKPAAGFFAQFVKKAEPSPMNGANAGGRSSADGKEDATVSSDEDEIRVAAGARKQVIVKEDVPATARVAPKRGRPRKDAQPNHVPIPPTTDSGKKTFEDEMREVEEAAKQQVAAEEQGGEAGAPPTLPAQRRGRTANAAGKPAIAAKKKASKQPPPPHVLTASQRRDDHRADHIEPFLGPDDDHLEIDESADEAATPRAGSAAPVTNGKKVAQKAPIVKSKQPIRLPPNVEDYTFDAEQLLSIQSTLLSRCAARLPLPQPLHFNTDEYAKVSALLSATIASSESNSMLLISARGSGKRALVESILRKQGDEHGDDSFYVVRLNGFIHTDDKIASKEIYRQLGREMQPSEDYSSDEPKSYADTLATLLALLSHSVTSEDGVQVSKSVVLILEEFDLFATHPRQTLLYNLFDIAQSKKAPIAVLGLTTRVDVVEGLEKRVRSRFGHRSVFLGLRGGWEGWKTACGGALLMIEGSDEDKKAWTAFVRVFCESEAFERLSRRIYYTTKSLPEILIALLIPLATMPTAAPATTTELLNHFTTQLTALSPPDSKLTLLSSLSTLHIALLVCCARLTNIYNTEHLTFALVYAEYVALASKARLQASAAGAAAGGVGGRVWGRDVGRGAWDDLGDIGLLVGGRCDVGLEALGSVIGAAGFEGAGGWSRWCKEV